MSSCRESTDTEEVFIVCDPPCTCSTQDEVDNAWEVYNDESRNQ